MTTTPREYFLPSLLDRLTDDTPGPQSRSTREVDERRMFSYRRLRDSVFRDLTWLLNTGNFESVQGLEAYPCVALSTVNYGIPDLTGRAATAISPVALESAVTQAIRQFEPRILAQTLKVRAILTTDEMSRRTLGFEISGLLWGTPVPSSMLVRTEVDLETGHIIIKDFTA